MRTLVLVLAALIALVASVAQAGVVPDRIYSYMCLHVEQRLCLGISTDFVPRWNPDSPFLLQVKHRTRVEERGADWMRTRWSVFQQQGRIQLANFTQLCITRENNEWTTLPTNVVLKPCRTTGNLELFNLTGFTTPAERGTLRLRARPDQCLTVMNCERGTTPATDYCNPDVKTMYTGQTFNADLQRGSYVKMMPCRANSPAQIWTQQIDCAPGCSPYMMQGPRNTCDPECANNACNWDNFACGTPSPTPPTLAPTGSPTTSPTTSSPSIHPTLSPTTAPSRAPTRTPSMSPTNAPSESPTTSMPSLSPSSNPSLAPTMSPSTSTPSHAPSMAPTSSRPSKTPTHMPSASPSVQPSLAPSTRPSSNPSQSPTTSPSAAPIRAPPLAKLSTGDPLVWLWILLGVLIPLLCLLCIFLALCYRKRRREEQEKQRAAEGGEKVLAKVSRKPNSPAQPGEDADGGDIESPVRKAVRGSFLRGAGLPSPEPDDDDPNIIVLSRSGRKAPPPPPPASAKPAKDSGDPMFNVLPLQTPLLVRAKAAEPSDALMDAPAMPLAFSDDSNLTPRRAAAQSALSPDPSKRPPGAAPGLAWGGSQVDLSASEVEDKSRSFVRHQSQKLQDGVLPQALAQRSFKMPKEAVHEATSSEQGAAPPQ